MVALSELVTPHWTEAPLQLQRYNGFPALNLRRTGLRRVDRPGHGGDGAVGGEAAVRLCPAVDQPVAAGRESGAQAPWLLLLSMLVVFLVLAALYESWSIPLAVMLVVPLGLLGAVLRCCCAACPTTCSSRSA
jgi:multidrug efflux pump